MQFYQQYSLKIKKPDLVKRYKFYKREKKKLILKSIVFNKKTNRKIKYYCSAKYNKSKLIYFSELKNYCLFTGHSKSVYRKYKINRVFLKSLINQGFISGKIKSSF